MDHGTSIFLVGPDGEYIAQFSHDPGPDRIAAAIAEHTVV